MSQQPVQHAIHQLFAHHDLTADEADAAMTQIMQGEATPAHAEVVGHAGELPNLPPNEASDMVSVVLSTT